MQLFIKQLIEDQYILVHEISDDKLLEFLQQPKLFALNFKIWKIFSDINMTYYNSSWLYLVLNTLGFIFNRLTSMAKIVEVTVR